MTDLKIAVFTETFLPKLDGVVTITCLLLDHFKQVGIDALIVSPGQHPDEYNGFPVLSVPGVPMPMYPEARLGIPGGAIFERLRAYDPDLFHIINPWCAGLQGMRFARRLDKPLVLSFHTHLMRMARFYNLGFLEGLLWPVHRYVYNRADLRLATSLNVINELESNGFKETLLWRRGVDNRAFTPALRSEAMRARLTDGHPERTILLFVGRLAAEKQIEQLREVVTAVENTHLAIIGDGPFRPKLETVFAGLPVTFMGYLAGEALGAAYASSDIFTFPSAIETFGLVIAEAMAAGLPVVTSNVGGVPELIEDGVNGCVFEPNDIATMTAHVRALAADPDRRHSIGQAAHASIQHLTWDAIMDELVAHYHEVIRAYGQPRAITT